MLNWRLNLLVLRSSMTTEDLSQLTEEQIRDKFSKTVKSFIDLLGKQLVKSNGARQKAGEGKFSYTLPDKNIVEQCIKDTYSHLQAHIAEYGVIQQEIDIFKVAAWLGMKIWHSGNKCFPLIDVLSVMNLQLVKTGRTIPDDILLKIAKMTSNDKDTDKDGMAIGMNGLYMIFRSCYKLEIKSNP